MGIIGWSTTLAYSTYPTPATYTTLSETTLIQLPGVEVSLVEDTHLNVSNGYRTYVPGLKDSATISCEVNYYKATMTAIDGIVGQMKTWKITSPDEDGAGSGTPQVFTFAGFISKREAVDTKADEIMKIKFDIKISGVPTLA